MLYDNNTFEDLVLRAGIMFFKHNKDTDTLEYASDKCQSVFPHIHNVPKFKNGLDFYKKILKKDRVSLKNYLINDLNDKTHTNPHYVDIRYHHLATNEILWLRFHVLSSRKNDSSSYRYGSIQNVTKDKSQLIKTTQIAYTDNLTGLINRERMKQKISLAIGTAYEYKIEHSTIVINIDYLGTINTMFGYEITNDLIEEIANTILSHKRDTDIIARISSGKFIILLINTPEKNLEEIGQRFLDIIRNTNFKTRSGVICVTASGGGCTIPTHANTSDKVLSILEECLTKAKKRGRDNFVKYDNNIDTESLHQENIILSSHIINAVQTHKIHTAYQPILHCHDTTKNFMECLARIKNPDGSFIPAFKFISIAENIGFIKHIDLKLCENALEDLIRYPHLKLSINLSGHTLHNLSHNSALINLLQENAQVSSRLCLELTETIPLQDIDNIEKILKEVKEMGYKTALDDFGAGYNSFSNLKQFNFDIVKIDGAYVKNVAINKKSQIFTQILTDLSKKLDIEIVAEMIDNQADLEFIKSLDIDYYQGYYFAPPSTNFDEINDITYNTHDLQINKKTIL